LRLRAWLTLLALPASVVLTAPVVLLHRCLLLPHLHRRRSDFALWTRRLLLNFLPQLLLLLSALLHSLLSRCLSLRFGLLLHEGALLLLLCGNCLLARGLSLCPLVQANTFGLGAL